MPPGVVGSAAKGGFKWGDFGKKVGIGALQNNPFQGNDEFMQVQPLMNQGIIQRQQPMAPPNPYYDPNRMFRFGGFMRKGGKARPGEAYVVGENGPEILAVGPHGDANVIPLNPEDANHDAGFVERPTDAVPLGGQRNNPYAPNPPATDPQPAPVTVPGNAQWDPAAKQSMESRLMRPPAEINYTPQPPAPAPAPPQPQTAEEAITIPQTEAETSAEARPIDDAELSPDDPRQRLIRRPSDQMWEDYQKAGQTPTPKTSLLGRIISGIAKGSRNWDGQGGILGWAFSALSGGVGSGASEDYYDKISRGDKQRRLIRDLQPQMQREAWETKENNLELQPYFKQQAISLKQQQLQNQVLRDQMNFDSKLKALQAKLESGSQLYTDEQTGKVFVRFPNDPTRKPEEFKDPETGEQFVAPSKKQYSYNDPMTGQPITATGGQILNYGGRVLEANTRIANEGQKYNTTEWNKYQNELDKWNAQGSQISDQIVAAVTDYSTAVQQRQQLENTINTQGYAATGPQQQQLESLQKAEREAMRKKDLLGSAAANHQANKPNPPQAYTPQSIPAGKYAGRMFPSPTALRPFFPGKTDDEIRRKVEQNGGRFEK